MLLAEPQPTLPSTRTQWLDRHLNRVCLLLELTATQYRDAEEKYQSVGKWLSAEGSLLAIFAPEIYPQGSMLLGTTVRPWGRMEYDLDLVCQLHWCANQLPLTVYDWVYGRMNANETYAEMLEKLKRCLRLNYAGAFHMDILPACPNDGVGIGSIIVPDRKLECWTHSNPKGFAAWFFEKCRLRDELAERMLKGSVEPLPSPVPSEYKFPLQRIVQLMKRHRDVYFRGGHDIARSVILTTLAGHFYRGQRSLSHALESVLDGVYAELERHPTVPRIANPVHPAENFADTWDQEKYDRFKAYIRNFRQALKALLYPSLSEERLGLEGAAGRLGELLGTEKVTEAIRIEAKEMNEHRDNGGLTIVSSGILTGVSKARSIAIPRNQFFGR